MLAGGLKSFTDQPFGTAPTAIEAVPCLTVNYVSPQNSLQAFDAKVPAFWRSADRTHPHAEPDRDYYAFPHL